MILYRSARTAPGAKPSPGDVAEESRPTGEEEGVRRWAACASEGVARPVGIAERELIAAPQEEQKRPESGTSEEQPGQRINDQIVSRANPG